MARLTGLAPIIGAHTRLLILGSFPSVASLRDQRYYAHPQNHFWKILQSLWPDHPVPDASDYPARCAWVLARGLGIWDVYASCEREGSLDSAIRHAVVNDFSSLTVSCPQLRVIAHNGGESYKHAKHTAVLGLPVLRLPSSSPANASWSLDRKRAAWHNAAVQAGLI